MSRIGIEKPFYFNRRRKKSIVIDPETGERHTLKEPSGGSGRECLGGCRLSGFPRLHGSTEEAFYCNKLKALKAVKEIKDYQAQVGYPLRNREGKSVGTHVVDFIVELPDGRLQAREYKGLEFGVWKLKAALFSWCYPEIEYITVKRQDLT